MPSRESARGIIRQFDIRTPSEETPAHALSGGNQQKAVVARELSGQPQAPARLAAHARGGHRGHGVHPPPAHEGALEGKAVLLVSADLDELLALSDRIGVMYKGRIISEFTHETAREEEVGLAMTGGVADVAV